MSDSVVSNSQVVKTTCVEESRKLAAYESDPERLIGEAFSSFFWFENATAIAFTFCEVDFFLVEQNTRRLFFMRILLMLT